MFNTKETKNVHYIWQFMRISFGVLAILAGIDKFSYALTEWDKYLNPVLISFLPLTAREFMQIVGVIEILAGILVLTAPHIGGFVVSAWLLGIVLNLISGMMYLDIALRDLILSAGAFSLGYISILVRKERRHEVPANVRYSNPSHTNI